MTRRRTLPEGGGVLRDPVTSAATPRHAPPPLLWLSPPNYLLYEGRCQPPSGPEVLNGCVCAFDFRAREPAAFSRDLPEHMRYVRLNHPYCAIILVLADQPAGLWNVVNAHLGFHGLCLALPQARVGVDALRSPLRIKGAAPWQLANWLEAICPEARLIAGPLGVFVHDAACNRGTWDTEGQLGPIEALLRKELKRLGLPTLRGLWRIGVGLEVVAQLQLWPLASVDRVAAPLSYEHPTSINHLLRRVFDVSPSEVRNKVGWEWLVWRALTRVARWRPEGHGTPPRPR